MSEKILGELTKRYETLEDLLKLMISQNETLIILLGRTVYSEDKIRDIVIKNKREEFKNKYVDGYNSCDGTKNQQEISKIIGIDQSTFSPIINEWINIGIVYEVQKGTNKFYKRIMKIEKKE